MARKDETSRITCVFSSYHASPNTCTRTSNPISSFPSSRLHLPVRSHLPQGKPMRGIFSPNMAILVIPIPRIQCAPRFIALKVRQILLEDLRHIYHFFDMCGLKLYKRFWWVSRFRFVLGECYCCLDCCKMLAPAAFGDGICFSYHCGFRGRSTPYPCLQSSSQCISLPEGLP